MRLHSNKLAYLAAVVVLSAVSCGGSESEDMSDQPEKFLGLCSTAMEVHHRETSSFWNANQLEAYENLGPDGLTSYDAAFTYATDVSEIQGVLDGLEWACLFVPQTSVTRWAWEDT